MLALLGESRYQIIAPLKFTAYENYIDIEYRNPPRVNCDPVCDGFEELTFKIFMALDDCINPPAKCATFNYAKRACGVGEVWSRRPGAPHLKSATSIQLVNNLLELCCYGPDSEGCGLVVNMSLQEGVATLISLFSRAEFTEGSINDFVLFKELSNRTIITIPGITCEGDCVDVQSTKIMPVYTCPDCVPREYYDEGQCVSQPVEQFPNFPTLGPEDTDRSIQAGQQVYIFTQPIEWYRNITYRNQCTGVVTRERRDYEVSSTWTQVGNYSVGTNGSMPSISARGQSGATTSTQTNGISCVGQPSRQSRRNVEYSNFYLSVGGSFTNNYMSSFDHVADTAGTQFNPGVEYRTVLRFRFQLRDADGNVLAEFEGPQAPDATPGPDDTPCGAGKCSYFININATISIGLTVNLVAKWTRNGTQMQAKIPVRLSQGLTIPLGQIGPYCGVQAEIAVVRTAATIAGNVASVVIDRAVDAAITALVPVGGTIISQLVDVGVNATPQVGACTP